MAGIIDFTSYDIGDPTYELYLNSDTVPWHITVIWFNVLIS